MIINPLDQTDRDRLRKTLEENVGRYTFHEEILAFLSTIDHLQGRVEFLDGDNKIMEGVMKEQAEIIRKLTEKVENLGAKSKP